MKKKGADIFKSLVDLEKINYSNTNFTLEVFLSKHKKGELDLTPDYQRRFVWDQVEASRFIESLLIGMPVPQIFLFETAHGKYEVIDGQQRLGTIISFVKGDFKGTGNFKLRGLNKLIKWGNKSWVDLDDITKRNFMNYQLNACIVQDDPDNPDLKFEMFQRINMGGQKLSPHDIRRVVYRGPYLDMVKELANEKTFILMLGEDERRKRDRAEEYVLRFFAFYNNNNWDKYNENNVEKFLDVDTKYNQNIDKKRMDELRELFNKVCRLAFELFGVDAFRGVVPTTPSEIEEKGTYKIVRQRSFNRAQLLLVSLTWFPEDEIIARKEDIKAAWYNFSILKYAEYFTFKTQSKTRISGYFTEWHKVLLEVMK